eukprot:Awhi_evm1s5069
MHGPKGYNTGQEPTMSLETGLGHVGKPGLHQKNGTQTFIKPHEISAAGKVVSGFQG